MDSFISTIDVKANKREHKAIKKRVKRLSKLTTRRNKTKIVQINDKKPFITLESKN